MKVVVIGPGPKFLSGISYFTWKLATTLEATPILFRDMLPKFLFPGKSRVGEVASKIQYTNPVVYHLDWWNPWTWIKAVRVCNQHDIVVLEWWTASVAHMYAFIVAFCGQRIVVEVHETIDPLESRIWPLRWYSRFMRWYIWGRATVLVIHSYSDAGKLCDLGFPTTVLIPHGIYDQYEKLNLTHNKFFTVLFFGLVREYKGVKYLIDGFQKANLPNSMLYVAGEQWDKIPLLKGTIRLNIWFSDAYLTDDQIEHVMNRVDVVVLPYLRASSSGVAHIAMHYGLPIISTRVGGLADLSDYEGIHYVPVADSQAIAEELRHIYYNTRNKRFPYPERLEWSSIKKEWEKLFKEMEVA